MAKIDADMLLIDIDLYASTTDKVKKGTAKAKGTDHKDYYYWSGKLSAADDFKAMVRKRAIK